MAAKKIPAPKTKQMRETAREVPVPKSAGGRNAQLSKPRKAGQRGGKKGR